MYGAIITFMFKDVKMIYHIFYLPKLQNGDSNNRIKKKATSESPIPPATTPDEGSIRADSTTPPPPVLEPEMNRAGPEMEPEVRLIPRLVDTDGQTAVPRVGTRDENLNPGSWTCDEVAQFLEINEIKCDPLVEAIIEQVSFFAFLTV